MRTKSYVAGLIASAAGVAIMAGSAWAEELTVATVNNGDMIIMQKLSPEWEKASGNKINWVVLEENVLRQRVTTDIATKSGQFDILRPSVATKRRSGARPDGFCLLTILAMITVMTISSSRFALV